ncbi:N-acetyltransferase [Kribbella qitaiheensis]|uniref:N-acetyltransferase n=1 Tax=Kribbella qitaiheensis TaxID=1544730 RepID=A0A7G6X592_9ACTN|nr:N-acetyltransferase [Kribbella qitaiheensis]QNE21407.1 N-acetyltransferase [Kribbella qitaiheensis]
MSERVFVPDDFVAPIEFAGPGFRLEPLGPQHNVSDHAAWSGSIEYIRATAEMGNWPPVEGLSLEKNLADLDRHAADFAARRGFTYTVLEPGTSTVIGCVYIYPAKEAEYDARLNTWVRADRAELDEVLHRTVVDWISTWPLGTLRHR